MSDRILLVEDEALVAEMVRLNLEHAGYVVEAFADGESALQRVAHAAFDIVLLDVMLPGISGFDVARRLRDGGATVPILLLTARADTISKVAGLDAGADDYLAKPFAMPELLARVRALRRRHIRPRGVPSSREVRFGRYRANFETRAADTNEGATILTEKECQLLEFLAGHEGELLGRTDILENVWGMDRFPTARTVDNYVLRLRKLFEPDPEEPRHLVTVRGRGYRFVRE